MGYKIDVIAMGSVGKLGDNIYGLWRVGHGLCCGGDTRRETGGACAVGCGAKDVLRGEGEDITYGTLDIKSEGGGRGV
ncbi:hypothetical protein E2C01_071965 [Portunus trituberculatus]|uniref:Uncharacterized protein n=1 Tax=Portunus trituberculatus TaxID=210409 RepID=A0A5B7I6I2_PORTR|nr:hypothetical protein [Portunus trituberculatus]